MKIHHVVSGLVLGLTTTAPALAYQVEATGTYIDFDDLNDSSLAVQGQYFFAPVDDSAIPRAEADFLRRASNIGLGYATFDEADVDTLAIFGEAYFDNFYAAAGLTQTDSGSVESDDISLEAGLFVSESTRLSIGYDDADLANLSRISLNGKMVQPLNGGQAFNGEFSIGKSDDVDDTIDYSIGGDFFVNNDLSLGLEYADTDATNSNEAIQLRARWFVIPTLSLQFAYNSQDFNDSIAFGVTGRF